MPNKRLLFQVISSLIIVLFKYPTYVNGSGIQEGSRCAPEGSLAPHPTDCSSFLMCNHRKFILRPCHGGLHWDNKHQTCRRAENVQCSTGQKDLAVLFGLDQTDTGEINDTNDEYNDYHDYSL